MSTGKCYTCGSAFHYANKCPKSRKTTHNDDEKKKTSSSSSSSSFVKVTCHKCGLPGHYANQCQSRATKKPKTEVQCYRCKEMGHYSNMCPKTKQAVTTSSSSSSSSSSSARQCSICLDAPVEIVLLPCGHSMTCMGCTAAIETCPICRCAITQKTKIFFA